MERRRNAVTGVQEPGTELLLEASDSTRRLLQQGLVLAGGALFVAGVVVVATAGSRALALGWTAVVLGAGLAIAASRVLVSWEVRYEGHIIRFENSVVFGERLVIDGERITQGALGYRKVLEGTIKRGTKAGRRVRAESVAGLFGFQCKITVCSP